MPTASAAARSESRSSILKNTAHFLRILRLFLRRFLAKRGRTSATSRENIFKFTSECESETALSSQPSAEGANAIKRSADIVREGGEHKAR